MKVCTNIDFTMPVAGPVDLAIYDAQGRRVRQLFKGRLPAGTHGNTWDGRDPNGSFMPNGVYFLRLRAPGRSEPLVQKIVLAR
jgi:flagellar hook assembly protein FlgD